MLKKLFTIVIILKAAALFALSATPQGGMTNPSLFLLSDKSQHSVTVQYSELVGIVPGEKLEKQKGLVRFWSETRGKEKKVFMAYFSPRSVGLDGTIHGEISGVGKGIRFNNIFLIYGPNAYVAELSSQQVKSMTGGQRSVFLSGEGLNSNFTIDGSLIEQVLK